MKIVGTVVDKEMVLVGLVLKGSPTELGMVGTQKWLIGPFNLKTAKGLIKKNGCSDFELDNQGNIISKNTKKLSDLPMYDKKGNTVDKHIEIRKTIEKNGELVGGVIFFKGNKTEKRLKLDDLNLIYSYCEPINFTLRNRDNKSYITGKGKVKREDIPTESVSNIKDNIKDNKKDEIDYMLLKFYPKITADVKLLSHKELNYTLNSEIFVPNLRNRVFFNPKNLEDISSVFELKDSSRLDESELSYAISDNSYSISIYEMLPFFEKCKKLLDDYNIDTIIDIDDVLFKDDLFEVYYPDFIGYPINKTDITNYKDKDLKKNMGIFLRDMIVKEIKRMADEYGINYGDKLLNYSYTYTNRIFKTDLGVPLLKYYSKISQEYCPLGYLKVLVNMTDLTFKRYLELTHKNISSLIDRNGVLKIPSYVKIDDILYFFFNYEDIGLDECKNLRVCKIDKNFTSYLGNSFKNCSNLSSFEVSEDNPLYKSINGVLYLDDDWGNGNPDWFLLCCPEGKTGKVVIPNGIEYIHDFAFYNCNLDEIVIPDTVKEIGKSAFENCKVRKELVLPKSVKCISENALLNSNIKMYE